MYVFAGDADDDHAVVYMKPVLYCEGVRKTVKLPSRLLTAIYFCSVLEPEKSVYDTDVSLMPQLLWLCALGTLDT
jgi:hypothetical protein